MDAINDIPAELIFFMLFAGMAVGGALSVIFQKSPLYSALSLIVAFIATAAIFVILHAQFVAALQLVVYAGAIIVLFVFVIMLLSVKQEESRLDTHRGLAWIGIPVAALTMALVAWVLVRDMGDDVGSATPAGSVAAGRVELIGEQLFTKYLLPFEVTSILIIMAIVGSVVLARRASEILPPAPVDEVEEEDEPEDEPDDDEDELESDEAIEKAEV